jgi:hypothetical protein
MRADYNAEIEMLVEPRAGAYTTLGRLDRYTVAGGNAARLDCGGVELDLQLRGAFAQDRQCTMLGLANQCRLRTRQNQRKVRCQIGPSHWADRWLRELRQWRVGVLEKRLRIEFPFPRWGGKAARRAVHTHFGMFSVTGLQCPPHATGIGAQLLQCNASRGELITVGGVDVAIPELLAKVEPDRKINDDFRVGACFAGRRRRRTKLDQRLCFLANLKADL